MNRSIRPLAALFAVVLPLRAIAAPLHAVLYKNPECTCCDEYAAYLRHEGFDVDVKPTNDLVEMSLAAGVPEKLSGCHLTQIAGYVVEGHVQVSTIRKLLATRPNVVVITLPGMPPGTPGMTGTKSAPLLIYAISNAAEAPTIYDVQ